MYTYIVGVDAARAGACRILEVCLVCSGPFGVFVCLSCDGRRSARVPFCCAMLHNTILCSTAKTYPCTQTMFTIINVNIIVIYNI